MFHLSVFANLSFKELKKKTDKYYVKKTLTNFNYYRSYRLQIQEEDDVKVELMLTHTDESGEHEICVPGNFELLDINLHYLTLQSNTKLKSSDNLSIKLSRKRFFNQWDVFVEGYVMHSYCDRSSFVYAISIKENIELHYFLKEFVNRFSKERLKDQLILSSIRKKGHLRRQGIETYSLSFQFARLFYKTSSRLNIQQVLREAARLISCEDINIWVINPEKNKLFIKHTTKGSADKPVDIRHAHLGSVFSTQEPLNILNDKGQLKLAKRDIKNLMAAPIFNKENSCVGVIEFLNQYEIKRFNIQHENIMRLCAQLISSLFESFRPHSKNCEVNEFNDSSHVKKCYLGHSNESLSNNKMISKFRFTDQHIHIMGEVGTGKSYLANLLTDTGRYRNLDKIIIDIKKDDVFDLIGLNWNRAGSIIIENIDHLKKNHQIDLYERIRNGQRRVITTSERDLQVLFENKEFNPRLYHQISEGLVHLPPLRTRKNDIVDIAVEILRKEAAERDLSDLRLCPDSLVYLSEYNWPGNLKELSQKIKKALMKSSEQMVSLDKSSLNKEEHFPDDELEQLAYIFVDQSDKVLSGKQLEESLDKAITEHKKEYSRNVA